MLEKQLKKRKLFLKRTIERCSKYLNDAPQGTLNVACRNNRNTAYYHHVERSKKDVRLSPADDQKLIRKLATKDYYERIIAASTDELSLVSELLELMEKRSLGSVYEKLHPEKRILVTPIELTKEQATERWLRAVYTPASEPKPGNYYIPTKRGELVRSKAEYNIANALLDSGIPYIYEYPFKALNGTVLHPDFYVRNKNTGECFFWEHFGMMDDSNYVNNSFLHKLELYALSDIHIGKGLIATFSGFGKELEAETIKKLIRAFLL